MSLSSEGNISCCKVVPDDYFVPLDDVLGLSSESYTADAQNCGEKHKHNEPDVEDVLPFKKRKLDMAKKQRTCIAIL